ncbi:MAG: TetR/AcrR family transcriptional regulator [Crocinitomicaceae bacterium]
MTEKQKNIFDTALQLFATEGVDSTSTSKIAKVAGVSEGLIFRHFTNKEGLLQAILAEGMSQAQVLFKSIASEPDPKARIRKALEISFGIPKEDYNFWRLVYTLKWQRGSMESEAMNEFRASLAQAFDELNYEDPLSEARLIESILDGIATEVLLKDIDPKPLLACILEKYKLT